MSTYLDEIIEEASKELGLEEKEKKQQIINKYFKRLQQIHNYLKAKKALKKNEETVKGSQLSKILNANKQSKHVFDDDVFNNVKEHLIVRKIFEAYELTNKIVEELGLWENKERQAPTMTLYYSKGGQMYRMTDVVGKIPKLYKYITKEIRSDGTRLKFQESQLKKQLSLLEKKQNENILNVTEHYSNFSNIFLQSKKAEINLGYIAEAFERHWQIAKHPETEPSEPFDINEAWALYALSSGNAPYFTGGDVEDVQVKTLNASIISNINTVIKTMESLLFLLKSEGLANNAEEVKELYKKAFNASATNVDTIIDNWAIEDLDKEIVKQKAKNLTK